VPSQLYGISNRGAYNVCAHLSPGVSALKQVTLGLYFKYEAYVVGGAWMKLEGAGAVHVCVMNAVSLRGQQLSFEVGPRRIYEYLHTTLPISRAFFETINVKNIKSDIYNDRQ
jgi:hypothetical protein